MPPVTPAVSLSERTCDIKERLPMTMTPLHTFSSFPRFPQTHFALLVHYLQSIQQHLPQGLLLPISTPVVLAPRFSLEEQTSGSLCFLPPFSSSPAVHWEVLTFLSDLAGCTREETQANVLLVWWWPQLERIGVQRFQISQSKAQVNKKTNFILL